MKPATQQLPYDFFISYDSRESSSLVVACVTSLESKGYRCFVDWRDLTVGKPVSVQLSSALRASRCFMPFIGMGFISNSWTHLEIASSELLDGRACLPVVHDEDGREICREFEFIDVTSREGSHNTADFADIVSKKDELSVKCTVGNVRRAIAASRRSVRRFSNLMNYVEPVVAPPLIDPLVRDVRECVLADKGPAILLQEHSQVRRFLANQVGEALANDYLIVWLVPAHHELSISASLAELAATMGCYENIRLNSRTEALEVLKWCRQNENVFLIYEGYEHTTDTEEFFPRDVNCLITAANHSQLHPRHSNHTHLTWSGESLLNERRSADSNATLSTLSEHQNFRENTSGVAATPHGSIESPKLERLLKVLACFPEHSIPIAFLLQPEIQRVVLDEIGPRQLSEALRELAECGLLTRALTSNESWDVGFRSGYVSIAPEVRDLLLDAEVDCEGYLRFPDQAALFGVVFAVGSSEFSSSRASTWGLFHKLVQLYPFLLRLTVQLAVNLTAEAGQPARLAFNRSIRFWAVLCDYCRSCGFTNTAQTLVAEIADFVCKQHPLVFPPSSTKRDFKLSTSGATYAPAYRHLGIVAMQIGQNAAADTMFSYANQLLQNGFQSPAKIELDGLPETVVEREKYLLNHFWQLNSKAVGSSRQTPAIRPEHISYDSHVNSDYLSAVLANHLAGGDWDGATQVVLAMLDNLDSSQLTSVPDFVWCHLQLAALLQVTAAEELSLQMESKAYLGLGKVRPPLGFLTSGRPLPHYRECLDVLVNAILRITKIIPNIGSTERKLLDSERITFTSGALSPHLYSFVISRARRIYGANDVRFGRTVLAFASLASRTDIASVDPSEELRSVLPILQSQLVSDQEREVMSQEVSYWKV